jgi:hypothetical protein
MAFTPLSMLEYAKLVKILLNMLSRAKMESLKSLRFLLDLRFGRLELVSYVVQVTVELSLTNFFSLCSCSHEPIH